MFNVLKMIIERQRPLMSKFREIEERNGMKIVQIPCDMQSYDGQAEMRRLAWCIQEELTEACDTAMQEDNFAPHAIQEEMIDALHFLAEFMIVTGYENRGLRIFEDIKRGTVGFLEVMVDLGMLMNVLRNKPWKQTLKPFEEELFALRLGKFLVGFAELLNALDLTDEKLIEVYQAKHNLNQARIATGV